MNIEVDSTNDDEFCPRCGRPGMMSLKVPSPSAGPVGGDVDRMHVLCERCDINDLAAGPLIAFLTVHSPVEPERVSELADYVKVWIDSLR
jgi:ribosomal protein S27AE